MASLAERVADSAASVALSHFRRRSLAIDAKSDASPVTAADRGAERAMRAVLREAAPSHALFGEEGGFEWPSRGVEAEAWRAGDEAQAARLTFQEVPEYLWVLDPIDGTKSFVTGKPLFGVLVALLHRGVPVVGVVDAPALGERWVGVAGRATLHRDRYGEGKRVAGPLGSDSEPQPPPSAEPLAASIRAPLGPTSEPPPPPYAASRPCPELSHAYLYSTSPRMFAPGAERAAYDRLEAASRLPQYGCDCYAYGLVASGCADLVAEADMKPYDIMALVPVVQGAGGKITDWAGRPFVWKEGEHGWTPTATASTVLAAGDPQTHAQALQVLGENGDVW